MLFVCAAILGVLLGYLVGGRIANLDSLKLKRIWLVILALVIQLLIFPLFSDRPLLPYGTAALHILSYLFLFVFLAVNLRVRPLLLVGGGAVLNLLVIGVNGGRMPASVTALERAGVSVVAEHLRNQEVFGNVVRMGDTTRLNFLGDLLYLPHWIPFSTAFSIGDLLVVIGLAWLIAKGMKGNA